jgi:hypothetical protein
LVIAGVVLGSVLSLVPILLIGTSAVGVIALFMLSEIGYALTGWIYVRRWVADTVRISTPTTQQTVWILGSVIAMLGWATGVTAVSSYTGVQLGRVDQELITGDPVVVLALIILSLLVIGPAEEYLFRGVIQRRLAQNMSSAAAILGTSLLFVVPHAVGYLGGAEGVLLLSSVPFALAVVMGVLYERFDNLSVPILAHGVYNAILFATTYLTTF